MIIKNQNLPLIYTYYSRVEMLDIVSVWLRLCRKTLRNIEGRHGEVPNDRAF